MRVSPDGSKVALASFRAPGVALFSRDKVTGKIKLLQALVNGDGGINSLGFAIEVAFSKDSRFLYTLGSSAVSVFDVSADALKLVEVLENDPLRNQLSGGRGLELAPDGKALYAACNSSNTLVKFDIDVKTGKLTEKQVIRDGEAGVTGIEGIFNVACSPDGRHVYTASGRFRGDNAVSAFSVGRDGTLTLKQELFDGDGQLKDYEGGNETHRESRRARRLFGGVELRYPRPLQAQSAHWETHGFQKFRSRGDQPSPAQRASRSAPTASTSMSPTRQEKPWSSMDT